MIDRVRDSRLTKILIIVLVVVVLAAGGVIAYLKFIKNPPHKPDVVTNQAKTPPPPPALDRSTKAYTNADLGLTMAIPVYWKVGKDTPNFTTITAKDPDSGLTATIELSKNGGNHAPCSYAIANSELIKYTAPLPSQRSETYLSFLGNKDDPTKLCALMITGPKQFAKGDSFNAVSPDPQLAAQLPSDQIIAAFALSDDNTKFPELSKAQASALYEEVTTALKSLQIK